MHKQLHYKNSTIHYQCSGAGPGLVLLHGFGEDSSVWSFQKVLEQHFRLLMPDFPGSGKSEILVDMSMESLADVVYFMLQNEGIEKCILIGHSMGGYVALAFAERHEALLSGLGLFHSSAFADTEEKIATRKKGIAFMAEHGAANFLRTAIPNLYSTATKESKPTLIEQQLQAASRFSKETLIANYEAMIQRPDRTEVLRRMAVPVLFIFGKWDTAVPLQSGLSQCYLPQLAYIHVLDRSGHMGMMEETEKTNAVLNQYVSETVGLL